MSETESSGLTESPILAAERLARLRGAKRLGFVFSGGAARCAFQIGVVECLFELGLRPAETLGISGGSWNAAAVAVGNWHRLRPYWRFFTRMPYLDPSNLFTEERSPFRWSRLHRRAFDRYIRTDAVKASAIPVWVAVTKLDDVSLHIFDARLVDDPVRLLLASSYLPFFFTLPVLIDGVKYGDGGFSDGLPYEFLLERGCDQVVILAVKGESEGGLFRNTGNFDHQIPGELADRVLVIRPRHRLPCGFAERDWPVIRRTADIGYARAREVLLGEARPELTGIRGRGVSPLVAALRFRRTWAGMARAGRGTGPAI